MSFLEHECNISLAAALAFLDESLDAAETSQSSVVPPIPSMSPLPPTTPYSASPEPPVEAFDADSRDLPVLVPLTQAATTSQQLQLERARLPAQETTLVPVSSSNQLKSSKKKKKLNYDPNKARNERRFELACLRKEVKDLEMTLKQLQSMQGENKISTGVKRPRPVAKLPRPVTPGSGMSAVWEQICTHQLERRLRVERENIHLKMMYKSQVQVAKSIERLLQKRLALQDTTYSEISKHTSRIEVPQGNTTDADQKIFEELSMGVEESYQGVDDVFEAHDPERTHLPTREPVLRDSVNGKYMELFDNKIMPFDLRSTGDAWWRRWHNYKGHCAHENGPNNTIVEKFGLEMKDVKTRTTATFYVQQILRRHVEDDRIVIVWHAHIKPLEFEKKIANGVHYLEKGYVLIKPHIAESTTDSNETATREFSIVSPSSSNNFTKGVKVSPDGLCLLTNSDDHILRLFEMTNESDSSSLLQAKEGGAIYDYEWYPFMTSADPNSCIFVSTSRDQPVHLWDAYTGELRASYRAFDHMDELTSAQSLAFNSTGTKLFAGFDRMIRFFDLSQPSTTCVYTEDEGEEVLALRDHDGHGITQILHTFNRVADTNLRVEFDLHCGALLDESIQLPDCANGVSFFPDSTRAVLAVSSGQRHYDLPEDMQDDEVVANGVIVDLKSTAGLQARNVLQVYDFQVPQVEDSNSKEDVVPVQAAHP
ncbi:M96 mating-specific protein family [Phytophthora palmivora]|uniref:M96 mating-specific protein family n=1 Tax=Phytophthora palmivora TaxID=4796 RepID=A0A2P4YBX2_9STRA|nr:M96 mating-specific protein family [Phytophthora palmivora]